MIPATGGDTQGDAVLKKYFVRDAERAISVLGGLRGKLHEISDEEIDTYIVTAHGIKSGLANIGEDVLSGLALRLERAGKARDIAVMSQCTEPLINALQNLAEEFKAANDDCAADDCAIDSAFLREKLLSIKAACGEFDPAGAEAAYRELTRRAWPRDISASLEEISVCLLHSAFEDAEKIVGDMLVKTAG